MSLHFEHIVALELSSSKSQGNWTLGALAIQNILLLNLFSSTSIQ